MFTTKEQRINAFWSRVVVNEETTCWEWSAGTCAGYGWFNRQYAHRLSWELANGKPPGAKVVMHLCNNKLCVNPEHLKLGTHTENMRMASEDDLHWQKKKTHCPQGHEYTEQNTRVYRGGRYCITCTELQKKNKVWPQKFE